MRVRECAHRRRLGAGGDAGSVSARGPACACAFASASASACAGDGSPQLYQTTAVWELRPRPQHKGAAEPETISAPRRWSGFNVWTPPQTIGARAIIWPGWNAVAPMDNAAEVKTHATGSGSSAAGAHLHIPTRC